MEEQSYSDHHEPAADDWEKENVLSLRRMLRILWKRRLWVLLCSAGIGGASAAVAIYMTPIYRATVVLMAAGSDGSTLAGTLNSALGSLGGIASLAGVGVGSANSATEEAIAVLTSRQFTESFIDDFKLMPKFFAGQWDADAGKWRVGLEKQPTPARAFKYFDNKVRTVAQNRRTGMVTIQIDWRDRTEAAAWANELVQRINVEMRQRAMAKAEGSLTYLQRELDATSALETRQSINRLIEAQIKQRMLANVSQEYVFRVVDRAMAPDADDPVSPKKLIMTLWGALTGFLLGSVLVLMFDGRYRQ